MYCNIKQTINVKILQYFHLDLINRFLNNLPEYLSNRESIYDYLAINNGNKVW